MREEGQFIFFLRGWMSNFTHAPFVAKVPTKSIEMEYTFPTVEHYFMYMKAAVFKDWEMAMEILSVFSPADAKALGRGVRGYNDAVWSTVRYQVMLDGNLLKYAQNDDLKQSLIATGKKILVEANPRDVIWGIGLDENHEDIINPGLWRGRNLLGIVLMEVRSQLGDSQI